MANTFELIASSTVGSGGASSIDFTSIPSTYTDLSFLFSIRSSAGGTSYTGSIRLNSSSSSYSQKYLFGNGASIVNGTGSTSSSYTGEYPGETSLFTNTQVYIPNYAGSTNKSFSVDGVMERNNTTAYAILSAGLWSSTAAITGVSIIPDGATSFAQYSTAYLYGVKNA